MSTLAYMAGDATAPAGSGSKIIAHVCNDAGGWGRGFAAALSHRWPEAEAAYRSWYRAGADTGFMLGGVRLVSVEPDVRVANMIGQHGYSRPGAPAVRYEALDRALGLLAFVAVELGASVHMPRIGCGLAGGSWDRVEPLIRSNLVKGGVDVTVYDLPGGR